jgi:sugar phosphate isomerase/epimerase
MKLAFSTNAFTWHTLEQAIRAIAEAGYDGLEILADRPHAYPGELSDQRIDEIEAAIRAARLSVSNVNANCTLGYWDPPPPELVFEPSLIHPDPERRAARVAMIRRAIDLAAAVGSPAVSITSGRLQPTGPPQAARRWLLEGLRAVLAHAAHRRVRVGVENEPGLFVDDSAALAALIEEVGHPLLGANLDLGHAIVAGESIPEVLDRLAGRVWNCHIEDIAGGVHYHLVPGEGEIDFAALADQLAAAGYDGWLTVELYTCPDRPAAAARESLTLLRELWPEP